MISTSTAVIDANVFFGARLTSLVLFLAQTKVFRARWTEKINDEWVRSVHEKQKIPLEKLEMRRSYINQSVLDCLVLDYETLEGSFNLPDSEDEHVLAAAVRTRADVIVTLNLGDFPSAIMSPLGIEAKHPDDFLLNLFGVSPEVFIEAVKQDFEHYKAPPLTFEQYVEDLRKAGVPGTAQKIEELKILIDLANSGSKQHLR